MTRRPTPAGDGVAAETPTGALTLRLEDRLAQRLRWLVAIRLVVISSVALPYFLLQLAARTELPTFDFLYVVAGAAYFASLIYVVLLKIGWPPLVGQAHLQFFGDLGLVTGLVYHFGGTTSPFSILYLLVITVASILLSRRGGLTVAVAGWVLYAATVLALYAGWVPSPVAAEPGAHTAWRIVYQLASHLFGFLAVALMTSRLALSASLAERELVEKRQDLRELQVTHRDVVESIPSGLLTTDRDGVVTSANRAALRILGRRTEQVVGRPITGIGLFDEASWQAASGRRPGDGASRRELDFRRDERVLKVGFSVSQLTGPRGEASGQIVIFQDLTFYRKLQEELRLKDRMAAVGELASGIAHEIGNPLAAISGSAQMLTNSVEAGSSQQKLLDIMLRESQRLDRTIKGFLKFARPKDRSSVRFDIAALLAEHVELLRNSPEVSDDHQLLVDLVPASVSIIADPDQVSQIFWNLARNAIKAMPDGGTLEVRGTLTDDTYQIVFSDSGRGMSEEERAKLFQPFQSHFDRGTGIGMAIVYRIVQDHGGRLAVETREGRGTEITVELPAVPAALEAVPLEV